MVKSPLYWVWKVNKRKTLGFIYLLNEFGVCEFYGVENILEFSKDHWDPYFIRVYNKYFYLINY